MRLGIVVYFWLYFIIHANSQLFSDAYYTKGTIITKNDTINCFVDASQEGFKRRIKYKFNKEDKNVLTVLQSEVEYIETTFGKYSRVNYKNSSYLMEIIQKGEISLYKDIITKSSAPSYNGSTGTFIGGGSYKAEKLYLIKGIELVQIKKKKLKANLKLLMADHPEIMNDIEKLDIKSYTLEYNLKTLIGKYNRWYGSNH